MIILADSLLEILCVASMSLPSIVEFRWEQSLMTVCSMFSSSNLGIPAISIISCQPYCSSLFTAATASFADFLVRRQVSFSLSFSACSSWLVFIKLSVNLLRSSYCHEMNSWLLITCSSFESKFRTTTTSDNGSFVIQYSVGNANGSND